MSSFRDVIKEQFQQDNCTANVAYDATQEKDHTGRERERRSTLSRLKVKQQYGIKNINEIVRTLQ